MANVLTPPELHDKNSRSGFDLSNKVLFTSKFGEILPVKYWETLPGDKFKIKLNSFIRTADMSSVNFTRMRQYYNFYFVPYRLLWRDFPSFIVNRPDTAKQASSINSPQQVSDVAPYISGSDLYPAFSNRNAIFMPLSSNNEIGKVDINPRTIPDNTYPWFELDASKQPTSYPSWRFNPFGFLRLQGTFKLLQYLGYNSFISYYDGSRNEQRPDIVNAFPLLAYQKIYQDYFRNSQWEKENPSSYNVDYLRDNPRIPIKNILNTDGSKLAFTTNEETMLDLRYCNYNKDLFNGVLPSSQFGAKAVVKVSSPETLKGVLFGLGMSNVLEKTEGDPAYKFIAINSNADSISDTYNSGNWGAVIDGSTFSTVRTSLGTRDFPISETINKLNLNFSVLQLRIAEAQQRFQEISATNDANYKAQIEAHFGVKVSSLMSSLCDYLGGIGLDINQNVVQNTNLADSSAVNLGSYGTAGGDKFIEFEAKEHGLIMCVSYAVPQLEYIQYGTNFLPLKLSYTDWAIPEFDSLGLEAVTQETLVNPDTTLADFALTPVGRANLGFGNFADNMSQADVVPLLGYTTRYYDYKTDYDICLGDFHVSHGRTYLDHPNSFNGSLGDWSLRLTPDNYPPMYTASYGRSLTQLTLGDLGKYSVPSRFVADFPSYWLFKVNPHVVDSIFVPQAGQTVKSDVLRHAVFFDSKVVRNLSRSGLPY